ncbi:uncharacterized protein LOC126660421 [Mercurialis annua]|uniref:uncharacterized protein LOC126660421 n=1 Tax=Mercurialis annua TaxID=3986 RepID=UPI0021607055|nr:uncharacterized protein LOC126660421 [Mercurialis annua]
MDGVGGGGSYRIEAERWLTISEKLLTARDFQGAKSFAIRARESDPRLLEFADQIIAVADTLLAGELRVINYNTGSNNNDYYAILQIPRLSQSMELVANQYRKLALLLNPTRNRLSFAELAFRLVSEAWMVFSNPSKKALYDHELQVSQLGQFGQLGQLQQQPLGQLGMPSGSGGGNVGHHHQQQDYMFMNQQQQHQQQQHQQQQQGNLMSFSESPRSTRPAQPRMTEPIRPIAQHKPAPEPSRPIPATEMSRSTYEPTRPTVTTEPTRPTVTTEPTRPTVTTEPTRPIVTTEPPRPAATSPPPRPTATSPPARSTTATPLPARPATTPEPSRHVVLAQPKVSESSRASHTESARTPAQHKQAMPTITSNAESSARMAGSSTMESEATSFWTACPYCFILYEYPKAYEDCAIRCQKCKRAFHAAVIPSPPVTSGKDSYFCCWGYFPLGFSGNKGGGGIGGANWSPVSAMFATPFQGKQQARQKVIYKDDVYIELSDPSESDSDDDDWDDSRRKKLKNSKGKGTPSKNVGRTQIERAKKVIVQNGDATASAAGTSGLVNVQGEIVRRGEASSGRKRGAKDLGKLDLNVMFSNEVEEAVPSVSEGNGTGNGEEDNIEGIGFFEGLDEFLSSLPILSVVGDDKVKAS